MKAAQVIRWSCVAIIAVSLLSCVILAAMKSLGLVSVTVTAIDPEKEPVDHVLPLVKQKEALPDYEVVVVMTDGRSQKLGSKPDTSAAKGLEWRINDPICVADIATVRLQEHDVVLSDALAEVQVQEQPVTANGYRFEFVTQRALSVGISSFHSTPLGNAIIAAFFLAIVIVVVANLWPW